MLDIFTLSSDNLNSAKVVLSDGKKFDEYCAKQKINGSSLSWFVSKYGDIEGHKKYQEVNNKKKTKSY